MQDDQSYDVFISYAHADNDFPPNSKIAKGWVTLLAENLNIGPNVYKKKLFIDHQLRPGDAFNKDLVVKVQNSKLLVILLSQNYIDSKWCGKELSHFIHQQSNDPDKMTDVFVIELFPYEKFIDDIPRDISALRKQSIHAKFWIQSFNVSDPVLSGYPTPDESGEEASKHYWLTLNGLRAAIDERLRSYKKHAPSNPGEFATKGTILLADVTDDLEAKRNEVKLALQSEGIRVLPEGDYVSIDSQQEFEATFSADLKNSELFVQLLSSTPGRKMKLSAPLAQLQFDQAHAAKLPMMQWCEALPQSGQISDAQHARLFDTEFIRATNLNNFKSEIVERLKSEQLKREKAAAVALEESNPKSDRKIIFVDDLICPPEEQQKLRALLKQYQCDIRKIPPDVSLLDDEIVKEVLRPCVAGITVYTDKTRRKAAYQRLIFFTNRMYADKLPPYWGVYLQEGDDTNTFGIDVERIIPIYEQSFEQFLNSLPR